MHNSVAILTKLNKKILLRLITYLNFAAIGLFLKKLKPQETVMHANIPYLENEIYIVPLLKQDHSDKEIMKIGAF